MKIECPKCKTKIELPSNLTEQNKLKVHCLICNSDINIDSTVPEDLEKVKTMIKQKLKEATKGIKYIKSKD